MNCVTANSCVAVGDNWDSSTGNDETLIESWDGSSWSITPSPNPSGSAQSGLSGVSCLTASSCIAVGDGNSQTLVESWDGSNWSITPSPQPQELDRLPRCRELRRCDLLHGRGRVLAIKSDVKNLIEIWNGSTWNITSAPSADNSVMALNCVSSSWCVAVGFAGAQTRSETWNGSSWRTVPSPMPATP